MDRSNYRVHIKPARGHSRPRVYVMVETVAGGSYATLADSTADGLERAYGFLRSALAPTPARDNRGLRIF